MSATGKPSVTHLAEHWSLSEIEADVNDRIAVQEQHGLSATSDMLAVLALIRAVQAAQALADTDPLDDAAVYAAQKSLAAALAPFSETDTAAEEPPSGVGGEA